jgi:polyhydroxyalkanoate synthase
MIGRPMPSLEDLDYGLSFAGYDRAALVKSLMELARRMSRDPTEMVRATADLVLRQAEVALDVARCALGVDQPPVAAPDPGDKRFADRAWRDNPWLRGLLENYLVTGQWCRERLETSDLADMNRRRAHFALKMLLDALAPSNVPWLNPAVVKEAIDTGGLSLARGFYNLTQDMIRNGGRPRQVDSSAFELGRNLAATPGRVVLRNELMELLMYEAQTEAVFETPIVCSPPWINKYYVMDLAPGRSFIEYAVRSGFTVFAISYRNPDASMAGLSMEDYLNQGLLAALDGAQEITGSNAVGIFALCLGGTLAGIALAYLAATSQDKRIGWTALTNTLIDFREPGELAVLTDETNIARLERSMKRTGFLPAANMSGAFDWLRGNDLVWNYVVSNWYMGKQPPAFDILAWNADATNMPAAMHSEYLRTCYLENRLPEPGAFRVNHVPVDLSRVTTPLYVLGAENDHIAPWRSTYRTTQLVGGDARFTLTSSGHIAGIVNPPVGSKASHYVRDDCPPDPDEWKLGAERREGSWWGHWMEWAAARSGARVGPPRMPLGEPAPGRYVRNQAGPPMPLPKPRRNGGRQKRSAAAVRGMSA